VCVCVCVCVSVYVCVRMWCGCWCVLACVGVRWCAYVRECFALRVGVRACVSVCGCVGEGGARVDRWVFHPSIIHQSSSLSSSSSSSLCDPRTWLGTPRLQSPCALCSPPTTRTAHHRHSPHCPRTETPSYRRRHHHNHRHHHHHHQRTTEVPLRASPSSPPHPASSPGCAVAPRERRTAASVSERT
jgi:hypothetical protein